MKRKVLLGQWNLWATPLMGLLFLLYLFFISPLSALATWTLLGAWVIWSSYSIYSNTYQAPTFSMGFRVGFATTRILSSPIKALRSIVTPTFFFLGKKTGNYFRFAIVKFFWLPLMLEFFFNNRTLVLRNWLLIQDLNFSEIHLPEWNNVLYPFLISLLFFIDTSVFLFGYLFEAKFLKNTLRSVDHTWYGWAFALVCYQPFINYVAPYLSWHASEYPIWDSELITAVCRLVMVLLIAIYAAASVCLWTKASNMTNRGIVQSGVYGWMRHPAYASKTLFWLVGSFPAILYNPALIIPAIAWTGIYIARALTEEKHLMQDKDYRIYCEKVKYRFLPGIW